MSDFINIADVLASAPPQLSLKEAERLAADHFGMEGSLTPLPSERDANFRLQCESGEKYLLKISNSAEPYDVASFQVAVLQFLEREAPDLRVPRVIPSRFGEAVVRRKAEGGTVRLLSFLAGQALAEFPPDRHLLAAVACAGACLAKVLSGFDFPGESRSTIWDLQNAAALRPLIDAIEEPSLRAAVRTILDHFERDISPKLPTFRRQVIHGDLNPHNLLCNSQGTDIVGIIDFGDMVFAPVICDVAIGAAYQINKEDVVGSLQCFVANWHKAFPLDIEEIAILRDLVAVRMATTVTVASWRASRYPDNAEYILRNYDRAAACLNAVLEVPTERMRDALKDVRDENSDDERP